MFLSFFPATRKQEAKWGSGKKAGTGAVKRDVFWREGEVVGRVLEG